MDIDKNISNIMTTEIIAVDCEDSVAKVQELFDIHKIHHIIVKDGDGICGIISNNDMLDMLLDSYRGKSDISMVNQKAKDIMTSDPLTIDIDDSIGFAADIFLSNHIHALPILDEKKLAGIVTDHDLLRYAYRVMPQKL